ncbi:Peptidoglycan-binding Lysin subgroup [Penicillium expansum]|nr:Peptidoglycan-binding Lysin subgroup [Penicillium expansum]
MVVAFSTDSREASDGLRGDFKLFPLARPGQASINNHDGAEITLDWPPHSPPRKAKAGLGDDFGPSCIDDELFIFHHLVFHYLIFHYFIFHYLLFHYFIFHYFIFHYHGVEDHIHRRQRGHHAYARSVWHDRLNPAVGSSCAYLDLGYYVCVGNDSSTVATSTTSAGNGITTPKPDEPGMVSDCTKFWLVGSDDTCTSIASSEDITVADIEKWNPKLNGDNCGTLVFSPQSITFCTISSGSISMISYAKPTG